MAIAFIITYLCCRHILYHTWYYYSWQKQNAIISKFSTLCVRAYIDCMGISTSFIIHTTAASAGCHWTTTEMSTVIQLCMYNDYIRWRIFDKMYIVQILWDVATEYLLFLTRIKFKLTLHLTFFLVFPGRFFAIASTPLEMIIINVHRKWSWWVTTNPYNH